MSDLADAMAWAIAHREPFGAFEELPPLSLTRAQIAALEAEARRVLAEVEPDDAARERRAHREERACGYVLLAITGTGRERGSRTIEGDAMWRPRATRTRSGWALAGGWLDAAVPELPTRTDHTGPVGMRIFAVASTITGDGLASLANRYGRGPGLVTGTVIGGLTQIGERCAWDFTEEQSLARWLDVSPVRTQWHEARRAVRRYPSLEVGRGWCEELGEAIEEEIPRGTPAGWVAMQAALAEEMAALDAQWTEERAAIVAAQSREAG